MSLDLITNRECIRPDDRCNRERIAEKGPRKRKEIIRRIVGRCPNTGRLIVDGEWWWEYERTNQ